MAKFKINGTIGNYRFNLHAGNGEIIGKATQGYSSKDACKTGIASVKNNSAANVVDKTDNQIGTGSRYEIFASSNHFWFRLFAANGEQILTSEGYTTKQSCQNGISSVKINAPSATVEE